MAVCKRPAAVLAADANSGVAGCKRRRIVGTVTDFDVSCCLGEGAFGVVKKGLHRATGQTVAIKFLRNPSDDNERADADEVLREAGFLEACDGLPHLVGFHGVVQDPYTEDLCLVMEHAGQSLEAFLRERRRLLGLRLPEATVRTFMRQLLTGAKRMHGCRIIHRDINPPNILVGEGGEVVKICDFGLAMSMSEPPPYKPAGTMSYCAPEMLLGQPDYDELVDSWSLGCVMSELVNNGRKLFQIVSETGAPSKIFDVIGMPDSETWPEFASLPLAGEVPQGRRSRLRELFPEEVLSKDGFEVLSGLLTCNPKRRLTAAAALELPWFADTANSPADAEVDALALPRKKEVAIVRSAMPAKKPVARRSRPRVSCSLKKKAQTV